MVCNECKDEIIDYIESLHVNMFASGGYIIIEKFKQELIKKLKQI